MKTLLLPYAELKAKGITYSRVQLWRKVREGTFPSPKQVGANRMAWLESDLDAWIAQLPNTVGRKRDAA